MANLQKDLAKRLDKYNGRAIDSDGFLLSQIQTDVNEILADHFTEADKLDIIKVTASFHNNGQLRLDFDKRPILPGALQSTEDVLDFPWPESPQGDSA